MELTRWIGKKSVHYLLGLLYKGLANNFPAHLLFNKGNLDEIPVA